MTPEERAYAVIHDHGLDTYFADAAPVVELVAEAIRAAEAAMKERCATVVDRCAAEINVASDWTEGGFDHLIQAAARIRKET